MPRDLIVHLVRDRETKRTILYREEPNLKVIDRLYVDKNVCERLGHPDTLEVFIKSGKDA